MLAREITWTFASNITNSVLALGTSIVMARALGPAGQGALGLALFIPMIVAMLSQFGFDMVNATYAGLYKQERSTLLLQSLAAAGFGGVLSVLVICTFFFWLPIERGQFASLPASMVWLSAAYAPTTILATLLLSLVRGVGRQVAAAALNTAAAVTYFLLAILCLGWLKLGLRTALLVTCLAPFSAIFSALYLLRPYLRLDRRVISLSFLRQSLAFGLPACLANLATYLVYRANLAILGYMATTDQVGLFMVATLLAERLKLLPTSIASAFHPRLANELAERQQQVPEVFRLTVLVSFLSLTPFALLGLVAIPVLYGPEFRGAIVPFVTLLPGVAALGGAAVLSSDFMTRNKPHYAMAFAWSSLAVNVLLNIALIPLLGLVGAALASTFCYIAACVFSMVVYRRLAGVELRRLLPGRQDWHTLLSRIGMMSRALLRKAATKTGMTADAADHGRIEPAGKQPSSVKGIDPSQVFHGK